MKILKIVKVMMIQNIIYKKKNSKSKFYPNAH